MPEHIIFPRLRYHAQLADRKDSQSPLLRRAESWQIGDVALSSVGDLHPVPDASPQGPGHPIPSRKQLTEA